MADDRTEWDQAGVDWLVAGWKAGNLSGLQLVMMLSHIVGDARYDASTANLARQLAPQPQGNYPRAASGPAEQPRTAKAK